MKHFHFCRKSFENGQKINYVHARTEIHQSLLAHFSLVADFTNKDFLG
jgi:hypothetical protein